jgi:hypothetical protein
VTVNSHKISSLKNLMADVFMALGPQNSQLQTNHEQSTPCQITGSTSGLYNHADADYAWVDGKIYDSEALAFKRNLESSPGFVIGRVLRESVEATVSWFQSISDWYTEFRKPGLLGAALAGDLVRLRELYDASPEKFSDNYARTVCIATLSSESGLPALEFLLTHSKIFENPKAVVQVLFEATYKGNFSAFDKILSVYQNTDLMQKDGWQNTLLNAAIYGGSKEITEKLFHLELFEIQENHIRKAGQTLYAQAPEIYKKLCIRYLDNMGVSGLIAEGIDVPVLSSYVQFEKKKGGVTSGGLYHNALGEQFLIKKPQGGSLECAINEVMASAIYQYYLGDLSPENSLVLDQNGPNILITSKLLDGFIDLQHARKDIKIEAQTECDLMSELDNRLSNLHIAEKPLKGYHSMAAVIALLGDIDPNIGNVGLIERDDGFWFAKVDHGFAFRVGFFNQLRSYFVASNGNILIETADVFKTHFPGENLLCHGYHNLLNALEKVANTDMNVLVDLIDGKINQINLILNQAKAQVSAKVASGGLLTEEDLILFKTDISTVRHNALELLTKNQEALVALVGSMKLDRALYENDTKALEQIPVQPNESIFPVHYLYQRDKCLPAPETRKEFLECYQTIRHKI